MRILPIGALVTALAACAPLPPSQTESMSIRMAALADGAVNNGFALRNRYDLPQHLEGTAVYMDWSSKHHVAMETSVILWKDAAGHWQRDEATEVGPALLKIAPSLQSHTVRPLPADQEQDLERLIRDPRLYDHQPAPSVGSVSGGFAGMRVRSPYGQTTVITYQGHAGPAADIAKIASAQAG